MLEQIKSEVQRNMAPLIGDILKDFRVLITQEIALARSEVKQEVAKIKKAAIASALAVTMLALALILGSLMVVHLIGFLFPDLPLWACYGIVTVLEAGSAGALLIVSRNRAKDITLVPTQTVQTLREMTNG